MRERGGFGPVMAGFVVAEARGETDSGEGGRGDEPPVDSAVGSVVARHKRGNRRRYRQAWTMERAMSEVRFRTVGEVVGWGTEVPGIEVSEAKLYYWPGDGVIGRRCPVLWRSGRICRPRRPGKRGALGGPSAPGSEAGRSGAICG